MACPICKRATATDYRPFCSQRCADVDLSRWFSGSYSLPSHDAEADQADTDDTSEQKPH